MEGLTTLIFLAGLLIAWGVQQRKREKEAEEKRRKRLESLSRKKKLREQAKNNKPVNVEEEDLKNRHIKGTLNYSGQAPYRNYVSPTEKIEKLSTLKKAIIWSEILNKPVCER